MMPLPAFDDDRPYTHPEHPGTWKIDSIWPNFVLMRHDTTRATRDVRTDAWPGDWQAHTPQAPHDIAIDGAILVAPGVYELTDEHRVYAVPSASTDRLHQVTVNTRTGAMRCDGPHCDGRTCSHQKRVLAARAGF